MLRQQAKSQNTQEKKELVDMLEARVVGVLQPMQIKLDTLEARQEGLERDSARVEGEQKLLRGELVQVGTMVVEVEDGLGAQVKKEASREEAIQDIRQEMRAGLAQAQAIAEKQLKTWQSLPRLHRQEQGEPVAPRVPGKQDGTHGAPGLRRQERAQQPLGQEPGSREEEDGTKGPGKDGGRENQREARQSTIQEVSR